MRTRIYNDENEWKGPPRASASKTSRSASFIGLITVVDHNAGFTAMMYARAVDRRAGQDQTHREIQAMDNPNRLIRFTEADESYRASFYLGRR